MVESGSTHESPENESPKHSIAESPGVPVMTRVQAMLRAYRTFVQLFSNFIDSAVAEAMQR